MLSGYHSPTTAPMPYVPSTKTQNEEQGSDGARVVMGRVWFLRTRPWPPRWWTYEGAVKADFLLAATVLRQFVHQADESAGIVPNAPQAAPASPPGGPGIEENSQTAETRARRRLEKVIYFARYRGAKGNAGRSEPTTFNLALLLQRNNKHTEAVEYWLNLNGQHERGDP